MTPPQLAFAPVDALKVLIGTYGASVEERSAEWADDATLAGHIATACRIASDVSGIPIPSGSRILRGYFDEWDRIVLPRARLLATVTGVRAVGGGDTDDAGEVSREEDAFGAPVTIVSPPAAGWPSGIFDSYAQGAVMVDAVFGYPGAPTWAPSDSIPDDVLSDPSWSARHAVLLIARQLFLDLRPIVGPAVAATLDSLGDE